MKNKCFLFGLFLLTMSIISCGQNSAESAAKNKLSANEFAIKIQKTENAQYVDVRTPAEYTSGHIKHFINIDYKNEGFEKELDKLDKNKPTFIYCRSGKRSEAANKIMNKLGFKEVYDLQGGILSWQESGQPIE
ncbi:MAG TPA: rhodanese-like domain-containing protein [Bacteroidia bacterium]|nr:rhodanese-like domain-containing protein [Bacteroidia bacterium]